MSARPERRRAGRRPHAQSPTMPTRAGDQRTAPRARAPSARRRAPRSYWPMERLFEHRRGAAARTSAAEDAPLAVRMRPRALDELVGQEHLLGAGLDAAHRDRVGRAAQRRSSTGRRAPARRRWRGSSPAPRRGAFEEESAVNAGRAEVRAVIERAARAPPRDRPADDLLPRRDPPLQQGPAGRAAAGGRGGPVTLIGATTENPYFEVNSALLSRSQIYELRPLEPDGVARAARAGAGRPRARDRRPARDRRRGARAARRRAPAATPGPRSARWSARSRRRAAGGGGSTSRSPRTRSSARR